MKTALNIQFWDDLLSGLALHAELERQRGDQATAIRLIQLLYDLFDARTEPDISWESVQQMLAANGVTYRARVGTPPDVWLAGDIDAAGHAQDGRDLL